MNRDEYRSEVGEMESGGFEEFAIYTSLFNCAECKRPAMSEGYIKDYLEPSQRYREFVVCLHCGQVQEL
jgi:hypothetical protein